MLTKGTLADIRRLIIDAEVETAAACCIAGTSKRLVLRRVLDALVVARNAIAALADHY